MKVIQSIQRAIDIINCFNNENNSLTINKISEELSLNINTTRGIINTLVYNDLLEHNSKENIYTLGSFFLSKADLSSRGMIEKLKDIARSYLKQLAEKYNVSTRLQIVFNSEIMTIETVNPENSYYTLSCDEYISFPLHATSSGKLFLRYKQTKSIIKNLKLHKFTKYTIDTIEKLNEDLKKIDENGYSKESEETGLGISSISIPIFKNENKLFATISLTGLTPIIEEIEEEASFELLALQKRLTKDFLAIV